ncbi:MAG: enoyl-CoA hydratase/isomerase family protein [Acidimicrobiales bacterium]
MGEPTLTIDHTRATIRLNRPDKRNRIEPADLNRLAELLDEAAAARAVRVLILTGEGPSFCSGYHLGALGRDDEGPQPSERQVGFGELCDQLEALPQPTIAALNGSVHGGGTDLALACDFRIGVAGSAFGMPAARIGLQYYASGIRRYVSRLGAQTAKRLFLTAEPIDAEEMLRIGFLDALAPPDQLAAVVDRFAASIEAGAPLAIANMKRAINEVAAGSPDWDQIEAGHVETLRSADHREALRALAQKRPPSFTGA